MWGERDICLGGVTLKGAFSFIAGMPRPAWRELPLLGAPSAAVRWPPVSAKKVRIWPAAAWGHPAAYPPAGIYYHELLSGGRTTRRCAGRRPVFFPSRPGLRWRGSCRSSWTLLHFYSLAPSLARTDHRRSARQSPSFPKFGRSPRQGWLGFQRLAGRKLSWHWCRKHGADRRPLPGTRHGRPAARAELAVQRSDQRTAARPACLELVPG